MLTTVSPRHPRPHLLLLGAVALSLAACSAATPDPPPSTVAKVATQLAGTPPPTGAGTPFRSTIQHYSITYPTGWTLTKATTPWRLGAPAEGAVADTYRRTDSPEQVTVASQALPHGMSTAAWVAQYLPANPNKPECFGPPSTWAPYAIDGHLGGLLGRAQDCGFTEAIVMAGGRAYTVYAVPDADRYSPAVFPQSDFDAITATMTLTP